MSEYRSPKVVHVHTDVKFITETRRFDGSAFDNTVLIIGDQQAYSGPYGEQGIRLSRSRRDLEKAVKICSGADLVVLYNLDMTKSYLATRIPRSTVVAWRFFGFELYSRHIEAYLSARSLAWHHATQRRFGISLDPQSLLVQLAFSVRRAPAKAVFTRAARRADLFLGLSEHEYDHLVEHWGHLPPFVRWPAPPPTMTHEDVLDKDNTILIGNSRAIYNNHLDVMDLIECTNFGRELTFLVPFSYGTESAYSDEVRRRVRCSPRNFRLIEDFMPYEAYFDLVGGARAAVFNSYRQMAMGNIYSLLGRGVKVYLNTRNVIHRWLVELGLKVYTVEDFARDLESDNLELSSPEKQNNAERMKQLHLEFSTQRFADEILASLEHRRASVL